MIIWGRLDISLDLWGSEKKTNSKDDFFFYKEKLNIYTFNIYSSFKRLSNL